ncbi:hypothetical protein BKH46_07445 [Helicobacter sp. 12S02634-8]|uniref:DUF4376 domain-containing protein n=1 Tax=Helicobacter sp. 12S02634-8 TaxID=1476199 RepID=UPI000BA601B3|nr:hypothetical protein [Helicobacter sp. 12S02634-8]PAF46415.1 hypothetical protein BKH46_07445 [Helicobacter sp. 12S02634-8]
MHTYKLPIAQIQSVQGNFKSLYSDSDFVYIQSDTELNDPFIQTQIPEPYIQALSQALESKKTEKKNQMNIFCAKEIEKCNSNALGEEYIYDLGLTDQINILALVVSGNGGSVRAAKATDPLDKSNISHTKEELSKLYEDMQTHKNALLAKCGKLKDKIQEANTEDEVRAIAWEEKEEQTPTPQTPLPQPQPSEPINAKDSLKAKQ